MTLNYALINELKENNQDFELYPTTKTMLDIIYYDINLNHYRNCSKILDIGCGTGNFHKYIKEYCKNNPRGISLPKIYGMEKSKILIDRLDKDIILLGTDFNNATLFDKKIDIIFCNPPYSEYETWVKRIIAESNCRIIYLVIPSRWAENKEIQKLITDTQSKTTILETTDFINSNERQARAKVDILKIVKPEHKSDYAFDKFFDETFKIEDIKQETDKQKEERIANEVALSENPVDALINNYNKERESYLHLFNLIAQMDEKALSVLGIGKYSIKESLKETIANLKTVYWKLAFDNLTEITERLTHKTRSKLFEKFKEIACVDFNHTNVYATVIWVIKNSYQYYNEQTVDFYKDLSEESNITLYKSNQKVFKENNWRFSRWESLEKNKYKYLLKLDYRIVCDKSMFVYYDWSDRINSFETGRKVEDIVVVCKNLGFEPTKKELADNYGKKGYFYFYNKENKKEEVLFEYKYYKNGNCHIKFNIEFTKCLNIVVSRILGWIQSPAQAKEEMPKEMHEGIDKYFNNNNGCMLNNSSLKMLPKFSD